ncbi:autotransporter outer membrane beta-barrel domain-containing protein [Hyphomicrobium sulfonivorans]|uniref:autotransporter family protein n=1 Tax=Hyphomicrobium sulfonivorans TaxID=121290 RepID=UPI00156F0095|nr:autotransporter outer membrane beta-barrel domain-containing protein [Hyphomicrobium sulfonivorans]MBI1651178.1 autotransporter outer membrane beta-barrel domain-containing protein [Hyphomicrobium sulfonivorans]
MRRILVIGSEVGDPLTAPGVLDTTSLTFGAGDGGIVFNHTGTNYIFDTPMTGGISGDGEMTAVAGRTILNGDHTGFTGGLNAENVGILQVNGDMSNADATTTGNGTLEGLGTVANIANSGIVAPGTQLQLGTLTALNYVSTGGRLHISAILGDDSSPTDRLHVLGDTSGTTAVAVTNVGGSGAQTYNGIMIVEVDGVSAGAFNLIGNFVTPTGQQAVVGGAYAYALYQGGVIDPADGNWYLRSEDISGVTIYNPGVPLYQSYAQQLFALNRLPTLEQRVGNRLWGPQAAANAFGPYQSVAPQSGVWVRLEGERQHFDQGTTTGPQTQRVAVGRIQAGFDQVVNETPQGKTVAGFTAQYAYAWGNVSSRAGNGTMDTSAWGLGGTLTWYGTDGFYADAQAQILPMDTDLKSSTAAITLASGRRAIGYGLSVEIGQRYSLGGNWDLTPQAQLMWTPVGANAFADVWGAYVDPNNTESLIARIGLQPRYSETWIGANGLLSRSTVYGIANIYQELTGDPSVDVSGVRFNGDRDSTWGGLGLGGTWSWSDEAFALYGEGAFNTSLNEFGDSFGYGGTIGLRSKW